MPSSQWDRQRTRTALKSFRQNWDVDSYAFQSDFETRKAAFGIYWAYYANTVFLDSGWNLYKAQNKLYRMTRPMYNPVTRLCDFYADAIYPGPLSKDAENMPEGVPLAIPIPSDTDENIREALGQLWTWANWQDGKSIYPRYGAIFGSVLLEVVDDLDSERVLLEITKPDKVADIVLDRGGNVEAYALEYDTEVPSLDVLGRLRSVETYKFRKEVDAEEFRYYKNDQPFEDFPGGAVQPNPYGFVPAVWARHRNLGADYGAPAVEGIVPKIDELNSLGTHTLDQIHKVIGAPILIAGEGKVNNITDVAKRRTAYPEDSANDVDPIPSESELLLILKAQAGTNVSPLVGNLDLGDAIAKMDKMMAEIESDRPELTMWRQLREMQVVSAPGAMKLLGDVTGRVTAAAAQYDLQYQRIEQMRMAIAGWRYNSGSWTRRDDQQAKFAAFNLETHTEGDLLFEISPRPLITPTKAELYTDVGTLMTAVQTAKGNGIPVGFFFKKFIGWSEEEVAELESAMTEEQDEADDRQVALAGRQASVSALSRLTDSIGTIEQ